MPLFFIAIECLSKVYQEIAIDESRNEKLVFNKILQKNSVALNTKKDYKLQIFLVDE